MAGMENDFELPESETPCSSHRSFLVTVIILLGTLILFSLCVIALLVTDRREELIASLSKPTSLPPSTPLVLGTAASPSSSASAISQTESSSSQQTPTAELPKGAYRIVKYGGLGAAAKAVGTPVPHNPHRIIQYGNSSSEEESK